LLQNQSPKNKYRCGGGVVVASLADAAICRILLGCTKQDDDFFRASTQSFRHDNSFLISKYSYLISKSVVNFLANKLFAV
jgi:hypothetical protein